MSLEKYERLEKVGEGKLSSLPRLHLSRRSDGASHLDAMPARS